jgi:dienelactone hydrolase
VFGVPNIGPQADISTKVLILHGWEDPMAKPADVEAVAKELTAAKADWQLHAYGHAMHAFTGININMPERGLKYDANADRRSWAATLAFLNEVFG